MTEFMAMMWVMCLAGFLLLAIDVLSEPFPSQQFLEEAREPAMVECLRHVRRSLHEFPELKWEEEQTSALYGKSLTGLVWHTSTLLHRMASLQFSVIWKLLWWHFERTWTPSQSRKQDHANIRASDPGKCMPLAMICMSPCHIGEAKLLHRHRHLLEVRQVEMLQGVTVTRSKLDVDGKDIERVCRYCAFINQKCHVKNKDIRKYLDGIYVSDKGTIDVE